MFKFAVGQIKIRHVATEKNGNEVFFNRDLNPSMFRIQGTVDQQRLCQRELVELFNLQQTVSKHPTQTELRILSGRATSMNLNGPSRGYYLRKGKGGSIALELEGKQILRDKGQALRVK